MLLSINMFGNRVIRWANGISTVGKVFALSLFIAGGLWLVVTGHANNYAVSHPSAVEHRRRPRSPSLTLATIAALYAFTGFESIANAAEEMETPDRTLPRAIPLAVGTVGVIYVLAVVVAMCLGADKIVASHDIVQLPAAIGSEAFRTVIVLGALVSMFGINVAGSFGAPRLWTALSDQGILPIRLSQKNKFGVPMLAFAITASLALAFPVALRFDSVTLTGLAVIARFVQFIIVPIALIALARDRSPEHAAVKRNAFIDTVLPVVAVALSLALAVSFDYRTILLTPHGGANYFSIALIVITFVVVPAIAYAHYYRGPQRIPGH